MNKRWKISLGIIAGLAVVLLIIWMSPIGRFILTGGLANLKEQPFDSQQWKNARTGDQATLRTRMMMIDDLQSKLKTGIDSLTIKEMLGEPERQYGFSYGVGMLTEGMDPMYLILHFDSVGHLSNWDVEGEKSLKGESGGGIEIKVN